MYRRPLQCVLRHVAQVTASRAAHTTGIQQAACLPTVSPPCVTTCRTLHLSSQMFLEKLQQEKPMIPAYLIGSKKRPKTLHESLSAGGVGWAPSSSGKDEVPHHNQQLYSVKETPQHTEEEVGPFTKLIEAMGFTGPLKYRKWKIKIAGLRMYTCCVERINYEDFLEKCSLPDTLNSWFLVVQLHVWMCLVRMRQEGRAGKFMCRYIVYSMWEDVEQRSMIMGVDAIHRKEAMKLMTEMFYAALFGYDEGILSDDCVLAAALWRNLFNQGCEDPRQLELMVEYVRKQMQYIDSLNGEDLLLTGEVKWRPLVEENAQSILKVVTPTYNDTGL